MRCPHCDAAGKSSSVSQVRQSPDNAALKVNEFVGDAGRHYHDPRLWTAELRCSEGHAFTIRQKVPCTVPTCEWNQDAATKPEVVTA